MKTAEVIKEIILNAKQRNLISISEDLSTITYLIQIIIILMQRYKQKFFVNLC